MSWYIQALKNYTKFSGRAQRNEFWFFGLFNNLIVASFLVVDGVTSGVPALSTLFLLWTFIPALSVTVRRLHDTGRSGWWVLLAFIPIVGWLILVWLYVSDSQPGPNVYGENPKGIQLEDCTSQGSEPYSGLPTNTAVTQQPIDPLSNPTVYKLWLLLKGLVKLVLFCFLWFISFLICGQLYGVLTGSPPFAIVFGLITGLVVSIFIVMGLKSIVASFKSWNPKR